MLRFFESCLKNDHFFDNFWKNGAKHSSLSCHAHSGPGRVIYGFLALSKFRMLQGSVFESQGCCRADFKKSKSKHGRVRYEKKFCELRMDKNGPEVLRFFESCLRKWSFSVIFSKIKVGILRSF